MARLLMLRHLKPVAAAAMRYSRDPSPLYLADMVSALGEALETHPPEAGKALVISCEGLSGHLPGWPGVENYAAAPTTIATLCEGLGEAYPDVPVDILLTLRRPEAWLHSAWRHHLIGHRMTLDYPAFRDRYAPAADLPAVAAAIAEQAARPTRTLWLEDMVEHPLGPGGAFVAALGLPDHPDLRPGGHSNRGPDAALAADLLALNRSDLTNAEVEARKIALLDAAGVTGWARPG